MRSFFSRYQFFTHISASILVTLFTVLIFQLDLNSLNEKIFDIQTRTLFVKNPLKKIKLVSYTDQDSDQYYNQPHIPIEAYQKLILKLKKSKFKSITILGSFTLNEYSQDQLKELASIFLEIPQLSVGYTKSEPLNLSSHYLFFKKTSFFPALIETPSQTQKARAVITQKNSIPSIFSHVASLENRLSSFRGEEALKHHLGEKTALIKWQGPPSTYPISSLSEFIRRPLTNKNQQHLIIGQSLSMNLHDWIQTPFLKKMSRLEVSAHSIACLMENTSLIKILQPILLSLVVLLSVLLVNLFFHITPASGLLCCVIALLGSYFSTLWVYSFFSIWVPVGEFFCMVFISYYLVIPYRLINEYRQKWAYIEKNKIIKEIEELKTNFLSLISHDLKTPIAELQGGCEIVNDMYPGDNPIINETLLRMKKTTQRVSDHVEMMLNFIRVEHSQVSINKKSQDINKLISEVIDILTHLAQDKNIQLEHNLEPLFSFKYDPVLMKQVLINLIENAIIYSPKSSTVSVSSTENTELNKLRLHIKDQGPGIPEQYHQKIFRKFERGPLKNSLSTKESERGSGLGLYLVKYFVELHEGTIKVSSNINKGSVFTVELPMV